MPLDNSNTEVLVIDDTVENIKLLTQLLTDAGYRVRGAASGKAALRMCLRSPPDLILLDIMMPDMDGYQVCSQLKSVEKTAHIPIIFLSALDNVQDKVKAFQVGAVDYIQKPFETMEVLARVKTHSQIQSLQHKLIARNEELKRLAETDMLTGLLNRRRVVAEGNSQSDLYAVILFDIDNFKKINDQYGHSYGDEVLVDVAKFTREVLAGVGYAARWGGEEFLVLLPHCPADKAEKIAQAIQKAFVHSLHKSLSASFGIAQGHGPNSFSETVKVADNAMYQGKNSGKNKVTLTRPMYN